MVGYKINNFECKIYPQGKVEWTFDTWASGCWVTLNDSQIRDLRDYLRVKDLIGAMEILENE